MLKVEHLSYEIEEDGKKQEILKDVSFEVADGEMLVVTGNYGLLDLFNIELLEPDQTEEANLPLPS